MSKNIFITGAAGFIGFHLACFLAKRGDRVMGYDNFNPYYDSSLKYARAAELSQSDVHVIEGDINDVGTLRKAIIEHQTTHLIHLAAQAGVRYSIENPHTYIETNICGFLNVLEICRELKDVPLIYASSSSVYGLNQNSPFSINDQTDQQASFYGVTKKTNELMAQTYHHLYGFPVTGLRFFTVYGPWGRPDMAYFSFTKAIKEGRPIDLYNYGQMRRDFTYIDDIVKGTVAAIDKSLPCALFNLGNHQPQALSYFIELIEKELGIKAKKVFKDMQQGDVVETYADIKESQELLGFQPEVSLDKGIHEFVKWYQDYYSTS